MKITNNIYKYSGKRLLLLVIGLLLSFHVSAQYSRRPYHIKDHQLGVGLGGGLYTNRGSIPFGFYDYGNVSFDVEFNYQYRFSYNKNWKVGIAIGYEQTKFAVGRGNITDNTGAVDFEGDPFIFKYYAKKYKETWNINQLNIPLTIEYSTSGEVAFYFRTGIKYSIQLKNKTDLEYSNLETSGYFPQWDVELIEPRFAGFGSFEQLKSSEEIKLDNRWAWVGEFGVKQKLLFSQQLYIGLYFDIGLNDQAKNISKTKRNVLNYRAEPGNALHAVSVFQTETKDKTVIKTYGLGVKLRYSF